MDLTSFTTTASGLVAASRDARLVLAPTGNRSLPAGGALLEEAECNLLARRLHGRGDIRLEIDGQDAENLGFLREGRTVSGRLNAGDRPGRIRFRILLGDREALRAELDVRPAKLDYDTHFRAMQADLERICRTLACAPPQSARIDVRTDEKPGAPLDFLQVATARLDRLCRTLRAVLRHPDRRLASHRETRPVSLARGDDPDAIAFLLRTPAVWTPLPEGPSRLTPLTSGDRRIGYTAVRETRRAPDTDTPANRHLVAALDRLCRRARTIARHIESDSGAAPYLDLCRRVHTRLAHTLRAAPLHNVPPAAPADPFPAHVDIRYTSAFALCRELMQALAPCAGGPFDLSYRDTPTLYEYWTWFALTEALLGLGFAPAPGTAEQHFKFSTHGLTVRPLQGDASAVRLLRGDREARLLYNPTYAARKGRSVTHDLRPDIVVHVHGPGDRRHVHAFDAKYRREWHPLKPGDEDGFWAPLTDDIDKMHAYRDAIGQVSPEGFERTLKSAVVLFPAPADPRYCTHRFYRSLARGIGGLPLLPGDPETVAQLRTYLQEHVLSEDA